MNFSKINPAVLMASLLGSIGDQIKQRSVSHIRTSTFRGSASPRLQELAKDPEVHFGYWRSSADGKACNGGKSRAAACPGLVEEIKGPLEVCTKRALHATVKPDKWKGDRLWIVALFGEVDRNEDKLGALKREIIMEVKAA